MDILQTDPHDVLEPLFEAARAADEFEFCCTLMRIRGMEDAGWDPLRESDALAQQLIGLLQAPLDGRLRFRLTLFLYCHLTEVDDVYKIAANLMRVKLGERYSMSPFDRLQRPKGKIPHGYAGNHRIDQLVALANTAGFANVGDLFSAMFLRPVRNAFYHSDYILTDDTFNIRWGEGLNVDNVIDRRIELEYLVPRLNLGLNTALTMLHLLIEHSRSYTESKILKGRLGHNDSWVDIQLITDPKHGLRGFRTPPATAEAEPGHASA